MKLPAQTRDRLSAMLDQRVFMFKGGFRKEDVLAEIADILATSASFSEQVIEASQVKKRCSLGHWHVTYRIHLRTILIPALRILVEAGFSMSTPELVNAFGNANVARMVGKYFAELRHFGLIEPTDSGKYRATPLAGEFIAGRAAIASWTWPTGEKLPPECVDGPPVHVDELTDDHPKDDKARHVEEAVPNV
jgi:hypothetical protein